MHEFDEGFAGRAFEGAVGLHQAARDFGAHIELAFVRLPVPYEAARAGDGKRMAACIAEELARQIALAESLMRQDETQHDQYDAEPGQHYGGYG